MEEHDEHPIPGTSQDLVPVLSPGINSLHSRLELE